MSWSPPEFENISLRHHTCFDAEAAEAVEDIVHEAAADNIQTALRHHMAIRLHAILNNINHANHYKIVIGGGRAAELYIHPVLQNILYQKGLYDFSYDFDLVAYRNTQANSRVWQPWGDETRDNTWNQNNHPALNRLLEAIQAAYSGNAFTRRELISHLRNLDTHDEYDFPYLDTLLQNGAAGSAFWKNTFVPADRPYTRIWQIRFGIPLRAGKPVPKDAIKWGARYYISLEFVDLKNAIEEDYLYKKGGDIYEDKGQIHFIRYPKYPFPREFFWEKWQRSDYNSIAIQVRVGTDILVVDPYVLYKEQGLLVGPPNIREEILGKAEYAKLDKSLRALGLYLPDGVTFDFSQQEALAKIPEKYKKRLVRLYCLFTMISQLQRLEKDGVTYASKLGILLGSAYNNMTMPIRNYFVYFSVVPFSRGNWKFKNYTDPENVKAKKGPYPFLHIAFDNELINWYVINDNDKLKLTAEKWSSALMKQYNTQPGKSQKYCSNTVALAALQFASAYYIYDTYQAHINTWIVAADGWRSRFHSAIYTYIETQGYSRQRFFSNLGGLAESYRNFIKKTLYASYLPAAAPVNKKLKIVCYRFGYPMNVIFKQSPLTPARLGLVDTMPVNKVVYTGAYLSTTIKNSGTLNLDTYRNVLQTGHTLYEFEVMGDGFVYFTYDYASSALAHEQEIFIPAWTKFYVKSKQWKYIADIHTAAGDTMANYKLVLVVRLAQLPETMAQMQGDIDGDVAYIASAGAGTGLKKLVVAKSAPKKKSVAPPPLPAVPLIYADANPGQAIPPGYDYALAAAQTGHAFETAPTAALQADHTLAANPLVNAAGDQEGLNEIDAWVMANFPFDDAAAQPYNKWIIQSDDGSGFFTRLDNYVNGPINIPYPRLFVHEFPAFGKQPTVGETIGDGTCMVHALLMSLSRAYRYHPNKAVVGRAYRQHQMVKLARNYRELQEYMNLGFYLEDTHLEAFLDKHNVNVMVHVHREGIFKFIPNFTYGPIEWPYNDANLKRPGRPAISILNEGLIHYSALLYRSSWIIGPQHCHVIAQGLTYLSAPNIAEICLFPAIKNPHPVAPAALPLAAAAAAPSGAAAPLGDLLVYTAGSPGRMIINRKATAAERDAIQAEFIQYRTNFEAVLGAAFPLRYNANPVIDGFFCWAAHTQNNFTNILKNNYGALFNVSTFWAYGDQLVARQTVLEWKTAIDNLVTWDTTPGQTLAKFTSFYDFIKAWFNTAMAYTLEQGIFTPALKAELATIDGVAQYISTKLAVELYECLEMIKLFSIAIATIPDVPHYAWPAENDIPEINTLKNQYITILRWADNKYGYQFPVFDKIAQDQTETYSIWDEMTRVLLKVCIYLNLYDNQAGGARKSMTRRKLRKSTHRTRKH